MTRLRTKYRIASARAAWRDYAGDGRYFITVCTANRECLFGQILQRELDASPIGEIVLREWDKSFEMRQELFCDAFVLMPNHLHAILRIENASVQTHGRASYLSNSSGTPATPGEMKTHDRASVLPCRSPKSISSFMAGFKSSATKLINEYRNTPGQPVWQARFHDHIIRNDGEFQRISNYIINNPVNWRNDKFNV